MIATLWRKHCPGYPVLTKYLNFKILFYLRLGADIYLLMSVRPFVRSFVRLSVPSF